MHTHRRGAGAASLDAARRSARPTAPIIPLLELQRSAGNAAVAHLIATQRRERAKEEHEHGAGCGHDQPVQSSSVLKVIQSRGRPVDPAIRLKAERGLGTSLGDVEMHTGAEARRSAAELGARAYTTGRHIVVGDGGHDEHTILHELRHTWQQQRGPVAGTNNGGGLSVSHSGDADEKDAEAWATSMRNAPVQHTADISAQGAQAVVPSTTPAVPSVQRARDDHRIVTVTRSPSWDSDDDWIEDTHSRNPRYQDNGVSYVTADSIASVPRRRQPDQNTLMGESAREAARRSGSRPADYSWLHRHSAWSHGNPVDGTPQRRDNMLVGTQQTNMHHLRYESAASGAGAVEPRMTSSGRPTRPVPPRSGVDILGAPITQMGSNGYIGPNQYAEAEYSVRSPYEPLGMRFSTRLDPYDRRPVGERERAGDLPSRQSVHEAGERMFARMTMGALPESEQPPEFRRFEEEERRRSRRSASPIDTSPRNHRGRPRR
ncbi:eCIS core domain-containing protein [Streptomyces sp. 8L]|uniref:eCIS core domain-containing protein n=1 Tax=Streptomyces sp. 8L TaxID=2877242 RepID=UPI001CD70C3E|nr:DUF4157 domain-containing protein [Streptomyces sp. 8L]MCA1224148.1 DUF4157 domain-containing protein [Streptomyces sp. 8L]